METKEVQDVAKQILELVSTALSPAKKALVVTCESLVGKSNVVMSLGGVNSIDQVIHIDAGHDDYKTAADLCTFPQWKNAFTNPRVLPPLSIFCPLVENSFIRIISGSHRTVHNPILALGDSEDIEVKAGQILLFRQDLHHGGLKYDKLNMRLHSYIDSIEDIRSPDTFTTCLGSTVAPMKKAKRSRGGPEQGQESAKGKKKANPSRGGPKQGQESSKGEKKANPSRGGPEQGQESSKGEKKAKRSRGGPEQGQQPAKAKKSRRSNEHEQTQVSAKEKKKMAKF